LRVSPVDPIERKVHVTLLLLHVEPLLLLLLQVPQVLLLLLHVVLLLLVLPSLFIKPLLLHAVPPHLLMLLLLLLLQAAAPHLLLLLLFMLLRFIECNLLCQLSTLLLLLHCQLALLALRLNDLLKWRAVLHSQAGPGLWFWRQEAEANTWHATHPNGALAAYCTNRLAARFTAPAH
jgi:hypothetical protein